MVNKFDVNKGLSEITKLLPKLFGYNNCITFILYPMMVNEFETIIRLIFNFIEDPDPSNEEELLNNIKKSIIKSSSLNSKLNEVIKSSWRNINSLGDYEKKQKIIKLFSLYISLGKELKERLEKYEIETISDMEFILLKIKDFRTLVRSSKLQSISKIYYISDYLLDDYSVLYQLESIISGSANHLEEISQLKRVIKNL